VTLYKTTESSETFELNGTENKTVEATPICFRFDLGYNESRVYYLKDEFEEIYVFKPAQPYSTYYFSYSVGVKSTTYAWYAMKALTLGEASQPKQNKVRN